METAIEKAIEELLTYSTNKLSDHETTLLIKAIAELHQVKCKIDKGHPISPHIPIEYSFDWARGAIFL